MAAPPGRGKPKKFVKCDRCGHKKHQKTSVCPYRHLKPREANALIARERAERAADRNRDDTDDDDDQEWRPLSSDALRAVRRARGERRRG